MPNVRDDQFGGVAKDTAPHKVPAGRFQEDQGGDRYFQGVWRRRRGMLRSDLAAVTGTGLTLLSFETPGQDYALIICTGTGVVHGFTNVGEQSF